MRFLTTRSTLDAGCRTVTLSAIDGEIRDINIRLEDKDKEKPLGKKERDALMFRLGVLTVERVNAQRAYEDARYRARDL